MTATPDLRRQSPLAHRSAQTSDSGAAAIAERAFEGKLILRGRHAVVNSPAAAVLGTGLPEAEGGTANGARATVQWLGPDEWLLITAPDAEASLGAELRAALSGTHYQLVDVTDTYTTIALSGARVREMLMKVATVDFHPRAFKAGQSVTTNFARTIAYARMIRGNAEPGGPAFDLVVRNSMADYLWCLLCEAGHEWGLIELDPRGQVRQHLPHFERV
jgi:sarcosine oxidase, subunit gamma